MSEGGLSPMWQIALCACVQTCGDATYDHLAARLPSRNCKLWRFHVSQDHWIISIGSYPKARRPIQTSDYGLHRHDRVGKYRYVGWVEACPYPEQGANTMIKFLSREVIPRFGIPRHIRQRQGLHRMNMGNDHSGFKGPEKIGMCLWPSERKNERKGPWKPRLPKSVLKPAWTESMPCQSLWCKCIVNRTHLIPHEMLTGLPMPTPRARGW